MEQERKNYRYIYLPSGDYIQIKFDDEGVVYDRFDENDEHRESYGYDLYTEIPNMKKEEDSIKIHIESDKEYEKRVAKIEGEIAEDEDKNK
jgi:hypothetical protein